MEGEGEGETGVEFEVGLLVEVKLYVMQMGLWWEEEVEPSVLKL